nr:DUF4012 domain-containing protein [Ktedonobacterales bacterium]
MSKPKHRKSHHVRHAPRRPSPGTKGRAAKRTDPVAVLEDPEEAPAPVSDPPPVGALQRGQYGAPPSPPAAVLPRDQWGTTPDTVALAAVDPPRTLPASQIMRRTRAGAHAYVGSVRHAVGELRPWLRSGLQRTQAPTRRSVRVLLVLSVALALLLGVAGSGIGAISDYVALKGLATSALDNLNRVPEDLGLGSKAPGTHLIGTAQKAQAAADLQAALRDFQALHDRLAHPDPLLSLGGHVARVAAYVQSGLILSSVAIDGVHVAENLLDSLVVLANALNTSALVGSSGTTDAVGGVTVAELGALQTNITAALPYINDIIARLGAVPPSVAFAALSASQRAKITPYLSLLPKIPQFLPIMNQFIAAAPAILGIGQPAGYLVMTMDPSEIRPSGGFQGNYAVMGMDAGRPGSLSLQDVYLLDKPYQATARGAADAPPQQYLSWWPDQFLPWGLRDANLAANFPTTAAYNLSELHKEGGEAAPIVDSKGTVTGHKPVTVTGFIAVEPNVIAQFLALAGPITIGAPYNERVTADNLQDKIHYYQLTNAGRKVGTTVGSGDTVSSANKRFTALIAKAIQARIKTLPKEVLLQYLSQLVDDLHTKDIQIAFTNPIAENFLRYYQISSELYLGKADSLAINNTNISGNKASQYLHEGISDAVQLDRTGGA